MGLSNSLTDHSEIAKKLKPYQRPILLKPMKYKNNFLDFWGSTVAIAILASEAMDTTGLTQMTQHCL